MSKVAFLDTNIYLHYQLFDQIKWPEVGVVLVTSDTDLALKVLKFVEKSNKGQRTRT